MQYICNPTLLYRCHFYYSEFFYSLLTCCYIRQHSFTVANEDRKNVRNGSDLQTKQAVNFSPVFISSAQSGLQSGRMAGSRTVHSLPARDGIQKIISSPCTCAFPWAAQRKGSVCIAGEALHVAVQIDLPCLHCINRPPKLTATFIKPKLSDHSLSREQASEVPESESVASQPQWRGTR